MVRWVPLVAMVSRALTVYQVPQVFLEKKAVQVQMERKGAREKAVV